jgi:transposase
MDHTLPQQIRLAIVGLREEGREYEDIAAVLGVGVTSVNRVLRRQRETGNVERLARGGGIESPIHGRIAELLCRIVAEVNDATLDELTVALVERGKIKTSRSAVVRAMARLGFSRKKSRWWRPSETLPSTGRGTGSSARSSRR